jgi:hypothetical protein
VLRGFLDHISFQTDASRLGVRDRAASQLTIGRQMLGNTLEELMAFQEVAEEALYDVQSMHGFCGHELGATRPLLHDDPQSPPPDRTG